MSGWDRPRAELGACTIVHQLGSTNTLLKGTKQQRDICSPLVLFGSCYLINSCFQAGLHRHVSASRATRA